MSKGSGFTLDDRLANCDDAMEVFRKWYNVHVGVVRVSVYRIWCLRGELGVIVLLYPQVVACFPSRSGRRSCS